MTKSFHDTRAALIDAAVHCFAAQGYEAASTRAIAQGAGSNLALIQYYFGGKRGLFEEVLRRLAQELEQRLAVAQASSATPHQRREAVVDAYLRYSVVECPHFASILGGTFACAEETIPVALARAAMQPIASTLRSLIDSSQPPFAAFMGLLASAVAAIAVPGLAASPAARFAQARAWSHAMFAVKAFPVRETEMLEDSTGGAYSAPAGLDFVD